MQVSQLELWHLIAVIIGAVASGQGLQAAIRAGFDWFKAKYFTPEPGPTQKQLLQALLERVSGSPPVMPPQPANGQPEAQK